MKETALVCCFLRQDLTVEAGLPLHFPFEITWFYQLILITVANVKEERETLARNFRRSGEGTVEQRSSLNDRPGREQDKKKKAPRDNMPVRTPHPGIIRL